MSRAVATVHRCACPKCRLPIRALHPGETAPVRDEFRHPIYVPLLAGLEQGAPESVDPVPQAPRKLHPYRNGPDAVDGFAPEDYVDETRRRYVAVFGPDFLADLEDS